MNVQIEQNRLLIDGQMWAEFVFPIKQAREVQDVVVVILPVPPDRTMTENVFGVLGDGHVAWQIERIPETSTGSVNCYMDLREEGGNIIVGNWNGTDVTVDVHTGTVLGTKVTR